MVAAAGAGPKPIKFRDVTVETLVKAIQFCFDPKTLQAARLLGSKMAAEQGVNATVETFYHNLRFERVNCDILHDQPAVWTFTYKKRLIRLSSVAAHILVGNRRIHPKKLKLLAARRIYNTRHGDRLTQRVETTRKLIRSRACTQSRFSARSQHLCEQPW